MNSEISFKITSEQRKKLKSWIDEQDRLVCLKQNRSCPNYGSCGGAYTYSFTPTSIGLVIKVKNGITNNTIDLTDYDNW